MALVSMELAKRAEKELEEKHMEDKPRFPYGLKIHLEKEQLERLGMTELPKVGKMKKMVAVVEVTDVHISETVLGEGDKSVGLQIKELMFEEAREENSGELENLFFGGNKEG